MYIPRFKVSKHTNSKRSKESRIVYYQTIVMHHQVKVPAAFFKDGRLMRESFIYQKPVYKSIKHIRI